MRHRGPPVWETVKAAFCLALGSVLQFPVTAASVAIILYAINPTGLIRGLAGISPPLLLSLTVAPVVEAIVFAPFALLVHRFIVLGDHADAERATANQWRMLRFTGALVVVKLVEHLWTFTIALRNDWTAPLAILLIVASTIVALRVCLAFPAMATDGSAAPFRDSVRYTRGSSWSIFFVFALIFLICTPLILAMDFTRNLSLLSNSVALHIVHRVVWHVLSTLPLVVYVAVASHLWKTRTDWSAAEAAPAGVAGPVGLGAA